MNQTAVNGWLREVLRQATKPSSTTNLWQPSSRLRDDCKFAVEPGHRGNNSCTRCRPCPQNPEFARACKPPPRLQRCNSGSPPTPLPSLPHKSETLCLGHCHSDRKWHCLPHPCHKPWCSNKCSHAFMACLHKQKKVFHKRPLASN